MSSIRPRQAPQGGPPWTPEVAPLRFPPYAHAAGLVVLVGGLFVAFSGAQVILLVHVSGPWAAAPVALLVLGVLALPVGGAITNARPVAAVGGCVIGSINAALSLAWGLYAASRGLVALLPFVAAAAAALGALAAALVVVPLQRYDRERRKLFAPEPGGVAPPSGPRPWPQIIAGAAALSVGGAVFGALFAPEQADRIFLEIKLLSHLRRPPAAADFTSAHQDFVYERSPFLEYLEVEGRFVEFDASRASRFADEVAEDVGWRMLLETGAPDISEAERAIWGDRPERVPLWIAEALRDRGAFYSPESLLSRSFDPALHDGEGEIHLDCDQLAHLFVHVAWRLDLDMRQVQSPFHMYLTWLPPQGVSAEPLTVETTNFRRVDIHGNRVDFLGQGIGEDFIIDADYHSSGRSGTWASPDLVEAAGLYEPATARDVLDAIIANVLVGVHQRDPAFDVRSEASEHLDGTRSYVLVSNLYAWTLVDARAALSDMDARRALGLAREAEAVRLEHPDLLLAPDPEEERVIAVSSALLEVTGEVTGEGNGGG